MTNILTKLMTSAVLVAGISGMSPALHAAAAPDAVSKLFLDARTQSSQLSVDWKSLTRQNNTNSTGDAAEILRMKEDVNAAQKTISSLNDSRSQASASQVAAIQRLVPVMEEITENTADAIEFLSGNQPRITTKEYKQYVEDGSDTSNRLSDLIAELVDYANHKTKFDDAKRGLELASN